VSNETIIYLDTARITDKRQSKFTPHRSASGYGRKIPTKWMIRLDGARWYRVYVVQFSNTGSAYILSLGERHFLGDFVLEAS